MRRLRTVRALARGRVRRVGGGRARWCAPTSASATSAAMRRASRIGLGVWAALALAIMLCAPAFGLLNVGAAPSAQAAALDSGAISIERPTPVVGVAEGPVGTNLYIKAVGLTAGDTYQLGYATQTATCAGPGAITAIVGATPTPAESNGGFFATFAWPSDAAAVGTSYYICAQDQTTITNPPVASTDLFRVDSAAAPSFQINAVDMNGTPLATPAPSNTLYAGGFVQITGNNFFPGGKHLFVQETADPYTAPVYDPQQALKIISGAALSDQSGSFNLVVQLPPEQGALYLNVVSTDGLAAGANSILPSLVASQQVTIAPPPATPTPTVKATATAASTPTPAPAARKGPSATRVAAVIGLGSVSVLLFLIGIILLVSAAVSPRPRV